MPDSWQTVIFEPTIKETPLPNELTLIFLKEFSRNRSGEGQK